MTAAFGRPPRPALLGLRGRLARGAQAAARPWSASSRPCSRREPRSRAVFARDWREQRASTPTWRGQAAALRARGIRFIGYVEPLPRPRGRALRRGLGEGLLRQGRRGPRLPGRPGVRLALARRAARPDQARGRRLDQEPHPPRAHRHRHVRLDGRFRRVPARRRRPRLGRGCPCSSTTAGPSSGRRSTARPSRSPGRGGDLLFFVRSGLARVFALRDGVLGGRAARGLLARTASRDLVPAALSLGLSGAGFWHSSVGGSHRPRRGARRGARVPRALDGDVGLHALLPRARRARSRRSRRSSGPTRAFFRSSRGCRRSTPRSSPTTSPSPPSRPSGAFRRSAIPGCTTRAIPRPRGSAVNTSMAATSWSPRPSRRRPRSPRPTCPRTNGSTSGPRGLSARAASRWSRPWAIRRSSIGLPRPSRALRRAQAHVEAGMREAPMSLSRRPSPRRSPSRATSSSRSA